MLAFGRFWCNGSNGTFQMFRQRDMYIYIIYIIYNKIGSTFFGEWNGLKPESEHDKHSQIINSALRSESKNPPFPGLKSLAWTAPGMPWFATWLAGPDFRHLFFLGTRCPILGPKLGQSSAHWAGGTPENLGDPLGSPIRIEDRRRRNLLYHSICRKWSRRKIWYDLMIQYELMNINKIIENNEYVWICAIWNLPIQVPKSWIPMVGFDTATFSVAFWDDPESYRTATGTTATSTREVGILWTFLLPPNWKGSVAKSLQKMGQWNSCGTILLLHNMNILPLLLGKSWYRECIHCISFHIAAHIISHRIWNPEGEWCSTSGAGTGWNQSWGNFQVSWAEIVVFVQCSKVTNKELGVLLLACR